MLKKILILFVFLGILLAVSPLYIQRGIFRNFSDISDYQFFANSIVKKGNSEPWALSSRYNQKGLNLEQENQLKNNKTVAYLVIQNDSILFEEYWKGYSDTSHSGSFSMAKSVVSMLMGIAIEEGKVKSINDYLSDYVPEFKRPGTDTIQIKDLLTMSGGFDWTESYINIFGKTADIYYGDNVKNVIGKLNAKYSPGKTFYYSSAETQMLGWAIENAYQQTIPELFSEKIWSKIGAENDAYWSLDKKEGTAKVFCCLNSNARDFARLGKLVLNSGQWNGQQIVPSSYIQEATTAAKGLKNRDGEQVDYYGYQFWIMNYKGLIIPYFRGVKGQFIYVIPEKNAIVIRLGEYVSQTRVHNHSEDSYMHIDAALGLLE
ncbi:MAG: beta-lactamase family protein [Chitinophagales bacterium]|nr:beta-lactamase family protein [Chitinophagales bacterium]MCZ2392357.1 beta-lactamase family protein [Chitinophagales bacterium]